MSEAEYCADEAYVMVMRDFGEEEFTSSKKSSKNKEDKKMENNKVELPKEVDFEEMEKMAIKAADSITERLSEILANIEEDIVLVDCPSIETVEKYMLRLSNQLFFIQNKAEKLGMTEVISGIKFQEKYNNEYLAYQTFSLVEGRKPTVKELETKAESNSLYELTLNEAYSKAYKLVKDKITAAESMLHVLNKIYSYRVELIKTTGNCSGKQILNEGV